MSQLKNSVSRKARKKAKAARSREIREAALAKDLEEAGWAQTPAGQWKICMYYESNLIIRTLHQAHKLQQKLNAIQAKLNSTKE